MNKIAGVVSGIKVLSPTVKGFTIKVNRMYPQFNFIAGQWVDTFIPNLDKVGGFSFCSSPSQLKENATFDLAIKYSTNLAVQWFHEKCRVGDELGFCVGGNFCMTEKHLQNEILLIAGGVGINPIFSMLSYYYYLSVSNDEEAKILRSKGLKSITLLYSAKIAEDFLFKNRIDFFASKLENFDAFYFSTGKSSDLNCRISELDIEIALKKFHNSEELCSFICGPTSMITSIENMLIKNKVPKNHIFYEKWW